MKMTLFGKLNSHYRAADEIFARRYANVALNIKGANRRLKCSASYQVKQNM